MRYPTRRRKAFRRTLAFLTSLILSLSSFAAFYTHKTQAFFPTNLFTVAGLEGRSHTSLTRQAIEELDNEFFGITDLTKPMKKAREQIADANAEVDSDQKTAAKHFDGESFPEGQSRLLTLRSEVVTKLNNNNAAGARESLGGALHTLQDFYAHSNWVELGNTSPHPGLGRPGTINRLAANIPTCQACTGGLPPVVCVNCDTNLITNQLTSGWYTGESAPFDVRPPGKCRHGGRDGTFFGFVEGINKDSFDCEFSPHNFLHATAASVAVDATKQFIRDIKADITPRQLKLLLGVGPTLAISIDTTGSMGGIINSVKAQAIQIVNARIGTDEEPSKYVLSPFNDPSTGPVTVTTDADTFKAAINSLFASGGGDCPELSQTGMLQALAAADDGGDLFMFTDASSKDSGLAGAVSSLATSKDIKIYPILFGSCSPIDPSYIRVANDSGGQLFFLSPSEAGNITKLADFIVRSNAVNVLSIGDTFSGTAKTYTVPVDSTMTRVTFSGAGTSSVIVKRPDGSTVLSSDPGVSFLSLSGGAVYSIVNPVPGNWSLTVNGSSNFSVDVSGESKLDLSSFRFVKPGGRLGHEGYFPIPGFPLAGEEITVDALVSGIFSTTQFEFRAKTGETLQPLSLTLVHGTTDEFAGQVTPLNSPFLVYLTGLDAVGFPYQRVLTSRIKPQTVQITAPPGTELKPGQTTSYVFQVKNLGPADNFLFSGVDDNGFVHSISPTSFALGTNETKDVTVELQPPLTAVPGSSDTLTVTAQNVTGEATNFAVVLSTVANPNNPPDCSQARPSVATLWPPNHKMFGVDILGVTDPDGDPVSIQIDRIAQDEPVNGLGDGDTCPDALGVGTSSALLRAERSGNGTGRVYTIFFTASDGKGGSCSGSVRVSVPLNRSTTSVDEGPSSTSDSCSP